MFEDIFQIPLKDLRVEEIYSILLSYQFEPIDRKTKALIHAHIKARFSPDFKIIKSDLFKDKITIDIVFHDKTKIHCEIGKIIKIGIV